MTHELDASVVSTVVVLLVIIIIIIIIAEMAVFNVAGKVQMACFHDNEDNIPNKFRILKERHIQMRKPYQLPGWTKDSSYYIVPRLGFKLTTSRLHSFIMAKVSHAHNHSAMEALSVCDPGLANQSRYLVGSFWV